MTSRICFSFAAIVALVLFLAAIPSRATERRDPLMVPAAQQQSAKAAHASHAKKPSAKNTHQQSVSSASADKASSQSVTASFEAKDQVGSEVSSGSSKNARTGAGK